MKDVLEQLLSLFLIPLVMFIGNGTYERDSFMDFQCIEREDALEVSGSTGDSGLAISKVTLKKQGHDLHMTVHSVLCGIPHPLYPEKKWLGSLNKYKIPLSPDISRVLLGKKRYVIWMRGVPKVELPPQVPPSEPPVDVKVK